MQGTTPTLCRLDMAHQHGSVTGSVDGASSTRYHYTDVNAGARLGNAIATAITQAREAAYRKRGQEVWAEFQRRAEIRRAQTEQLIQEFFSAYPRLQSRRLLVAAVAPWAAAGMHRRPADSRTVKGNY